MLGLLLSAVTFSSIACWGLTPPPEVIVVNHTPSRIYLYEGLLPLDSDDLSEIRVLEPVNAESTPRGWTVFVEANESTAFLPQLWPRGRELQSKQLLGLFAHDERGRFIDNSILTLEEWEQRDWRFVINAADWESKA